MMTARTLRCLALLAVSVAAFPACGDQSAPNPPTKEKPMTGLGMRHIREGTDHLLFLLSLLLHLVLIDSTMNGQPAWSQMQTVITAHDR